MLNPVDVFIFEVKSGSLIAFPYSPNASLTLPHIRPKSQVFKNPKGGTGEDYKTRVERGGAWDSFAYATLSSFRWSQKPKKKFNNLGFRIVLEFDAQSEL